MLKKLGNYIKECVFEIKKLLFENKSHLYVCLFVLALGFLIALSKSYENAETNNFVFVIISGNASPIPQIIRLILWLSVIYAISLLTSVHYILFIIGGYGGIAIMSYIIFSNAFQAISAHTLSGTIYLILYVVPTVAFGFIAFVCILREIYKLLNYDCNKRCVMNTGCHQKSIRKIVTPYWCVMSLFVVTYWLIFYLILILFA